MNAGCLRILLIEDDEDDFVLTRDALRDAFEQVDVRWETTHVAGIEALRTQRFDACLLDFRLGAETAFAVLATVRADGERTPIIVVTGSTDETLDAELLRAGASDYLLKSELSARQLKRAIRHAQERGRHLEATRRSEREFRHLIERLPTPIMIRRGLTLIYANPATAAVTGYADPSQLVGRSFLEFVHPDSHDLLSRRMDGETTPSARELRVFRADGSTMLVEVPPEHIPITFEGEPAFLTSIRDLTEEKRTKALLAENAERLEALSLTDELTRLHNRRGFLTFGQQQLRMARRTGRVALVLFVDLDGLKKINDELGHEAGDAAILQTAGLLRATFREVDILARLGGDEFVVMLVDCAAPDLPLYRLSQRVNEYNAKAKGPFRIAFSTGAATFDPTNPQELEELIKRADSAMYEQKRSKRRT